VIDHKRDLLCNRYIKKRVFPTEAARDPDVKKYFMNYNYARDGDEYLAPFVTQHDWQTEYNLNNGLLKQWDTTYGTNYADRGVRSGEDHQAAFGRMIDARPQQASSRVQASRSAYEDQAAKEAAAAAWEAERKGRQLAQLKQGILSPKLSPVASPGRRRSVTEITAGFGSRGKQVLPRTSASSVQLRAVTPRATPRRQASPQRAVQLRRVATPNRGTPRRGKTPVRATPQPPLNDQPRVGFDVNLLFQINPDVNNGFRNSVSGGSASCALKGPYHLNLIGPGSEMHHKTSGLLGGKSW
jgi:hypothetical protein